MAEKFTIAFDLDDTLYPESEFVLSGFLEVAEFLSDHSEMDHERIFNRLRNDFERGIRGDNFDRILEDIEADVKVEELVELYRSHKPDIELTTDTKYCLKKLNNRSISIITDGKVVKQRKKIDALGIKQLVDHVFVSEEFGSDGSKPSTRMFEAFLSTTGTEPENSVYIADNPAKDFIAPNTLGMRSIWVSRSWGEYTDNEPTVEQETPTCRVEDLRAVSEIIKQWEREV